MVRHFCVVEYRSQPRLDGRFGGGQYRYSDDLDSLGDTSNRVAIFHLFRQIRSGRRRRCVREFLLGP